MKIPTNWTADQARSVMAILHELADAIWDEYGDAIAFMRDLEREAAVTSDAPEEATEEVVFADDLIPF